MNLRKRLAPNNQSVTPIRGRRLREFTYKSAEAQSIKTWASAGKGVQGESVNASNPRFLNIRGKLK